MVHHAPQAPNQTIASADLNVSPRRRWRLLEIARRRRERAENNRVAPVVSLVCLAYFAVGLIVIAIDAEYLTVAWLFTGALGIALRIARDDKTPLLNVYTVAFSIGLAVCLILFVLNRGWLA